MSEELDVLKLVTKALDENDIKYMITGSIAANYYTVPRMTRDIDIVVAFDKQSAESIFSIFKNDFYIDREMVIDAIKKRGSFNIIHNDSIVKIDFIIRKDEKYRKVEFDRRQKVKISGQLMYIVSAEDLVISKLFWAMDSHSDVQLRDIKNILDDQDEIDKEYILEWVKELDLEAVYKKVRRE